MSDNPELALRAAINVPRDSIESGRMPSGLALAPEALAMHEAAIVECEQLLVQAMRQISPAERASTVIKQISGAVCTDSENETQPASDMTAKTHP